VAILALFVVLNAGCQQRQPSVASSPTPVVTYLPKETIEVGEKEISVEIADSNETRARGLMFRDSMEADSGMLFVFDKPDYHRFYMKNTRIPLSIAFIDAEGEIISVHDMQPMDQRSKHYPRRKASFALEMNQGWFERNNFGPGTRVELPKRHR